MKYELKYQPEKGGDWPFRVQYNDADFFATRNKRMLISKWCMNTFDSGSWYQQGASVWFKHREDALMFMLKWS